jgi:hypothetical protein
MAKRLNNSLEFVRLLNSDFKSQIVNKYNVFQGHYSNIPFLIYLDYSDHHFNNRFSIVFIVPYHGISDDKFKYLHSEYHSILRSSIFITEKVFFDRDYAEFRFYKSALWMRSGFISKKLEKLSRIIKNESLSPREFDDIEKYTIKDY